MVREKYEQKNVSESLEFYQIWRLSRVFSKKQLNVTSLANLKSLARKQFIQELVIGGVHHVKIDILIIFLRIYQEKRMMMYDIMGIEVIH